MACKNCEQSELSKRVKSLVLSLNSSTQTAHVRANRAAMDANVPRAATAHARQATREIAASEDGNFVESSRSSTDTL